MISTFISYNPQAAYNRQEPKSAERKRGQVSTGADLKGERQKRVLRYSIAGQTTAGGNGGCVRTQGHTELYWSQMCPQRYKGAWECSWSYRST